MLSKPTEAFALQLYKSRTVLPLLANIKQDFTQEGFVVMTLVFDIDAISLKQTNSILKKIEHLNRLISTKRSFEFISSHRGSQRFTFKVAAKDAIIFNQTIAEHGIEVIYNHKMELSPVQTSLNQNLNQEYLKISIQEKRIENLHRLLSMVSQYSKVSGIDIQELIKTINDISDDSAAILKELKEKDALAQLIVNLPKSMLQEHNKLY